MTIKVKRLLEYTTSKIHAELQFAKLEILRAKERLQDLIAQRDFASYHSKEEMESCTQKIASLSEILKKISRMESDIKYFYNQSLRIHKKL